MIRTIKAAAFLAWLYLSFLLHNLCIGKYEWQVALLIAGFCSLVMGLVLISILGGLEQLEKQLSPDDESELLPAEDYPALDSRKDSEHYMLMKQHTDKLRSAGWTLVKHVTVFDNLEFLLVKEPNDTEWRIAGNNRDAGFTDFYDNLMSRPKHLHVYSLT
jgi:hypothetical protein